MIDHHIDLIGCFCNFAGTSRPAIDENVRVPFVRISKLSTFVTHDMIDVDADIAVTVNFRKCNKGIHKAS